MTNPLPSSAKPHSDIPSGPLTSQNPQGATPYSQVDSRIRVLHFVESYASGVATAVSEYMKNTPEFDHVVIGRVRRGFDVTAANLDERTRLIDAHSHIWHLLAVSRESILELKPDVIHCHSSVAGLYGRLLALIYRIPAIYSPHAFAFLRQDVAGWKRGLFRVVEKMLSKITAAFVTAGPAESALATGLATKKPTYEAHPYVAILEREPVSPQNRDIDIVTAGRLAPQKDPELFARIVIKLRERGHGYRVVWIGDGDAVSRALLEKAGIEVTGWRSPDETMQYLARSRLYMHTAAWEAGIAYSIIEAAAIGLPVVARERPEIHDRPGIICFSTAVDGASAVSDLLETPWKYESESLNAQGIAGSMWREKIGRASCRERVSRLV